MSKTDRTSKKVKDATSKKATTKTDPKKTISKSKSSKKTSPKKKTPAKKDSKEKSKTSSKAATSVSSKRPLKKSESLKVIPGPKTVLGKPQASRQSATNEILNELATEIRSDDEQVRLGALERIAVIEGVQATTLLTEALKDSKYMVRIHAAAELGERKDKKAIDPLIGALDDESVFVRQAAAGALESIGGAKAKKAVAAAEKAGLLLDELPEGKRLDS
ncbi:MAG: HEAT repeat domain-containing protein [Candidatus Thorarchaeota archaeon]